MHGKKAHLFEFSSYEVNKELGEIYLRYKIIFFDKTEINFCEKLIIDKNQKPDWSSNPELIDKILFNIHIICGISYFKLAVPEQIIVKSGQLNADQAEFWNSVYKNGLGQYYYENQLDPTSFCGFDVTNNNPDLLTDLQSRSTIEIDSKIDQILLAFGGGKDSLASMELLKQAGVDYTLFYNIPTVKAIAEKLDEKQLFIERVIDQKLINKDFISSYLNGHIPITAIWSFICLLACQLYRYKYIVFSNERGSSVGNIEYHNMTINHQWSKSQQFEILFRSYIKKFITTDIEYFSLLRPYYEIAIIQILSDFPNYLEIFTSCNRNFVISDDQNKIKMNTRWCCRCPKCAFIFMCLACFIDKSILISIFGSNLLADPSLLSIYQQLTGEIKFKPFECVGTIEESQVAMRIIASMDQWNNDYIVKNLTMISESKFNKLKHQVFSYGKDGLIPNKFKLILRKYETWRHQKV